MNPGRKTVQEVLAVELPVSALVVMHNLVGAVSGGRDRHAVRGILRLEVLCLTYTVAEHHLTVGIYHLIHLQSAHNPLAAPFVVFHPLAVVQVQFRAVAVPQAVAHTRSVGAVLAAELLV